jgi:hypothetical protein
MYVISSSLKLECFSKLLTEGLGLVICNCNPNYLGDRDQRVIVRGQPRQKVSEIPPSTNKPALVGHTCNPSYV